MRRGGIDPAGRRRVQDAFRILYRSGLAPAAAVTRLRAEFGDDPLVARLREFVETSRLGIVPGVARSRSLSAAEAEQSVF